MQEELERLSYYLTVVGNAFCQLTSEIERYGDSPDEVFCNALQHSLEITNDPESRETAIINSKTIVEFFLSLEGTAPEGFN